MAVDSRASAFFKQRRKVLELCVAGIATSVTGLPTFAQNTPARRLDVPYEPSPQPVVDKMLELARVSKDDLLYDLGCGDGRIVITAAQKYGARGVGIDLDPQRIEEARANARKAGVEDRVKFIEGDLFKADISSATVVTLFLFPHVNLKLRPVLWRQLQPGTRVVSHLWDMGREWPPERTVAIPAGKLYYWVITETQKKAVG